MRRGGVPAAGPNGARRLSVSLYLGRGRIGPPVWWERLGGSGWMGLYVAGRAGSFLYADQDRVIDQSMQIAEHALAEHPA